MNHMSLPLSPLLPPSSLCALSIHATAAARKPAEERRSAVEAATGPRGGGVEGGGGEAHEAEHRRYRRRAAVRTGAGSYMGARRRRPRTPSTRAGGARRTRASRRRGTPRPCPQVSRPECPGRDPKRGGKGKSQKGLGTRRRLYDLEAAPTPVWPPFPPFAPPLPPHNILSLCPPGVGPGTCVPRMGSRSRAYPARTAGRIQ